MPEPTENTTYGNDSDYNSDDSPCDSSNVKAFSQVFLPPFYAFIFIVGVIGNGLVMFVLIKYRKASMPNMCLFNLALSDLLFLISLPFWAHYSAISDWTFGDLMCTTVTGFFTLGFYGSIFFMVLMTVDRYAVFVLSRTSLISQQESVKVNIGLALFMWALSLSASLPNIIFSQLKNETSVNETVWECIVEYPEKTAWKSFNYIQPIVLRLILPLSVMVFCYSRIIPMLMAMKSNKKHKAIKLILILIIVFFLFWTPYNVVIFLSFLQHADYMPEHVDGCKLHYDLNMAMQWTETIAFSHCCLNPIIYAFVGQKFRTLFVKALNECFPQCFGQCQTTTNQGKVSVYSRTHVSSVKFI